MEQKSFVITWTAQDVLNHVNRTGQIITMEQAGHILDRIASKYDASVGVNWNVIDMEAMRYLADSAA